MPLPIFRTKRQCKLNERLGIILFNHLHPKGKAKGKAKNKPRIPPKNNIPISCFHDNTRHAFEYMQFPKRSKAKNSETAGGLLVQFLLRTGYFTKYYTDDFSIEPLSNEAVQYLWRPITCSRNPLDMEITLKGKKRKRACNNKDEQEIRPPKRPKKFVETADNYDLAETRRQHTLSRSRCIQIRGPVGQEAVEVWGIGTYVISSEDPNMTGYVVSASMSRCGKHYQVKWQDDGHLDDSFFSHTTIDYMRGKIKKTTSPKPKIQTVSIATCYPLDRKIKLKGGHGNCCSSISTEGYIDAVSWLYGDLLSPRYRILFDDPSKKGMDIANEKQLLAMFDICNDKRE